MIVKTNRLSKRFWSYKPIPTTWPQFPELIHLNQSHQGRPIFWFHGGVGGVGIYSPLAQRSERPFYGIQPRGRMTNRSPLRGIQTMATYYTHIIQTVQPEGPYDLGGYSMAGRLAYEVTRQLQELGQVVNTIVMLDSAYGEMDLQNVESNPVTQNLQKRSHFFNKANRYGFPYKVT